MRIEMKVEGKKDQPNGYAPVLFSTGIQLEHVLPCEVQSIMVEAMQKIGAAETAAARAAEDVRSPKPRAAALG